jgi:hypothetical protein
MPEKRVVRRQEAGPILENHPFGPNSLSTPKGDALVIRFLPVGPIGVAHNQCHPARCRSSLLFSLGHRTKEASTLFMAASRCPVSSAGNSFKL